MTENQLINFINEARKRGFADIQIKKAMLDKCWPVEKIDNAFESLMPKFKSKNQVSLFLSDDLLNIIEKRAKKNMQTISEQIEEILRRSCVTYKGGKKSLDSEKIDDTLVRLFSRRRGGRERK